MTKRQKFSCLSWTSGEIVQQQKPDDLFLIPGTYMVKEELVCTPVGAGGCGGDGGGGGGGGREASLVSNLSDLVTYNLSTCQSLSS